MNDFRRPTSGELTAINEALAVCRRHEKLAYFLEFLMVPGFGLFLAGIVTFLPICCVSGLLFVYAAAWAMTNNVNAGAGRISFDETRVMDGRAAREIFDEDSSDPHDMNTFVEFVSSDGDVFNQLFPAGNKIVDGTPLLLVCAPTGEGDYNDSLMFIVPLPASAQS